MTQLAERPLTTTVLEELRASVRGEVVTPDDPGYDEVRRIWNAAVDRRPGAIARCTGVADVIGAVAVARRHELPLAVRGGGHNVAGTSLCDGGLVIDLQPMRGMRVDPSARRLVAQPGVRLGDVDHETQAFGLAPVSGINSETGLAGLTLGGGIGWQMRRHGLTIDHLLSADVVLADRRLVRASAGENEDIFWAIRGGGGNFGVVTAFELGLVEIGPAVRGGLVAYPAERAREVLRAYRDWAADAPDDVTTVVVLRLAPPVPWMPASLVGRPVLLVGALYAGAPDDGVEALSPLLELGPVQAHSLATRPFVEHQSMLDASVPAGRLYYWKSHYLPPLEDSAIEVIADHAWEFTSPHSYTIIFHMGGAVRRLSDDETAFTGRGAELTVNINCAATDHQSYDADRSWVRRCFDALSPNATGGGYVNFMTDVGAEQVRAAYGETKLRRLARIKATVDPDNVFRINQNIAPAR